MKINNYDTELDELLDCPFCGGRPVAHLIGNEYLTKIKITIKCSSCGVQRTIGSVKSIEWLEEVSIAKWNMRFK
jgi:transcription elongation factor Elf1